MLNTTTRDKIMVLKGQNIYDLAMQEYGSAEGVFQLIADNPIVDNRLRGLNDLLVPGEYLKLTPDKIINKAVVSYYKSRATIVHTGEETVLLPDFNNDFNEDFLIE